VTTYFAEAVSILDRLGPTGRIPEMLLVAVTNVDRYRDLMPQRADGSPSGIKNFVRFFQEELIPYVEGNYRVKDYRVVMGPQAGANFVMYTLFENPDLFQAAIINNPFRWQGGRDLILKSARTFFDGHERFKKFLHITYEAGDALAREGAEYVDRFAQMVRERNITGFDLHLNFIPQNDEFIQPMGLRTGLKDLFKDYPFPPDKEVQKLDDILGFYRGLSDQYGFAVDAPEHVLTEQSDRLAERGLTEARLEILTYIKANYPHSANAYWRLGNWHFDNGELEKARDHYQKIIEIMPGDNAMIRQRLAQVERRIGGSAAYRVEKEIRRAGIEAGLQEFRALKANPSARMYFDEREFNQLGYRLLGRGQPALAVEVLKLNVEMHPESANVYDSLGEAYMWDGQKELAVRNYEKSLELNPENQNAREMLKKLREKKQP
jgi:tetratricopeptide (TPR) repeat protein